MPEAGAERSDRMSPAQKTRQLFDEKCRKYSWASGATRGTPSAIERHRRDLEVVFSELNGLMAGMHYQDQTEGSTTPVPSLSPTQTAYGYPLEIFDDFLGHTPASDTACPTESASAMESEPMASQWAAIRTLRKETEYHHRRFQVLARRLENPIISDLLEIYPDGQSIRNKGACIVKDVLEGFQPSKLSIVFAFTCFSYSISQLLYKKNAIDKSDILADIRAWRDLITDPKERQAFNQLAPELWPEAKEHLHFIDIPTHPTYGTGRWANRWPQLTSLAASAGYSATELSHPHPNGQTAFGGIGDLVHPSDPYHFDNTAAPPSDPRDALLPFASDSIDLLRLSHEVYNFSDLLTGQYPFQQAADTGWSPTSVPGGDVSSTRSEVQPTELDPSNGERDSAQSDIKGPEDSKLDNTIMFLVVLVFLQDLGEWYLYTLSGRSLAPKRHKLYQAQQGDQESFHRKAQKAFFEPCSRHQNSSYSAFRALVSVAEMFTRHGYLQSIAEIKQYVISVASAVLLPGTAYEQIVSSVLTISDDVPVAPTQVTHATKRQKRPRAVDEDASSPEAGPRPTRRRRTCNYKGCDATYSDLGGLRKHRTLVHEKLPPIRCGECEYGNPRRDRVRDHFLKQHPGIALPERLRVKMRSFQGLRTTALEG